MSKHALKIQQVDERHEMLQRERINAATWPGKDLREIAVLQVTINNLEQSHAELVSAVREVGLLREEFKISSALRSGRNPNEIQKEFLVKLDELAKLAEVK